ncbi:MAG: hypothetical protein K2X66_05705 [Cyanobacteria bacterium]|nr:hypothetical protein [Cyanobacteriota bacterium]
MNLLMNRFNRFRGFKGVPDPIPDSVTFSQDNDVTDEMETSEEKAVLTTSSSLEPGFEENILGEGGSENTASVGPLAMGISTHQETTKIASALLQELGEWMTDLQIRERLGRLYPEPLTVSEKTTLLNALRLTIAHPEMHPRHTKRLAHRVSEILVKGF